MRLCAKLKSRRGESLAEVLVALLISAVAVVLLSGMVASSVRLIDKSTKTIQERYARNNASISVSNSLTVSGTSGTLFSTSVMDWQYSDSTGQSTVYYGPVVTSS